MRVFVLTTGRSGSQTFAAACRHIGNYTCGHESRAHYTDERRFDYPDGHIEVDNRLAWFLGELANLPAESTFFVHLVRDEEKVARSYLRRSQSKQLRSNLLDAFAHGILIRRKELSDKAMLRCARLMVRTINCNIAAFLRTRRSVVVPLEAPDEGFGRFWSEIGAEGSFADAMATLHEVTDAKSIASAEPFPPMTAAGDGDA